MRALQPVRAPQALLPEAARRHRRVSETARAAAELYGFAEMATPIFEFTEVFARPMGEHTDIVAKELYTFTSRGGGEGAWRPGTPQVCRLPQDGGAQFRRSGPERA